MISVFVLSSEVGEYFPNCLVAPSASRNLFFPAFLPADRSHYLNLIQTARTQGRKMRLNSAENSPRGVWPLLNDDIRCDFLSPPDAALLSSSAPSPCVFCSCVAWMRGGEAKLLLAPQIFEWKRKETFQSGSRSSRETLHSTPCVARSHFSNANYTCAQIIIHWTITQLHRLISD